MIPELLLAAAFAGASSDTDEEPVASQSEPRSEEDVLAPHRAPFEVLVERAIGTASVPVEFDWRQSRVLLGVQGHHYFELNTFDSLRAGGLVRLPSEGLLYEVGVGYVWVSDTPASEALALTPYRQPGRPQRIELDFAVGLPLAEGVVTAFPRWFPPVEMVFVTWAGLRYALYPGTLGGMNAREGSAALLSPTLSDDEIEALEERRLDAMQVDAGRYGLLLGFGDDLYFRQGIFLSPRLMLGVPLLAGATETDLRWWSDLSLTVGLAL